VVVLFLSTMIVGYTRVDDPVGESS